MAGLNTYTDISTFVNTIFEDALFVARDNNLLTNLVTVFRGSGMAARKNQTYGTATMLSLAETDDLASQSFTPVALSTLTPAEIGAQFVLTDQRLETDPFGVRQDAALELGMAIAQKIDLDLVSKFTSLTGGTVGGAGTALNWPKFFAAESILRAQNAPGPYTCVLHPYQYYAMGTAVVPAGTQTNAPNFQDDVMANWFVGSVGGVQIYVTSNITSGGTAYGAMFARPALAYDERRAPRLEPERDASRRAWELNMTGVYATGTWRPAFGVTMLGDASVPNP